MKKLLSLFLALVMGTALVCMSAAAEPQAISSAEEAPENSAERARLTPVRVWGTVTWLESGGIFLENSDETDAYHEIILHGEDILCLDAVTGLPMDIASIKDGDTIYAYVGPAMTMSLPPQATAQLILANIPADFAVPESVQIASVAPQAVTAIYPPAPLTQVTFTTTAGQEITITDEAQLTPYLTKQMVTLEQLQPGSRLLVWKGADGAVTKAMMFAYEYQGYAAWETSGEVTVNGLPLAVAGKTVEGQMLLPLRAVAEAAGYTVTWDNAKGAVVSDGADVVFSVLPGTKEAQTAGGAQSLSAACWKEAGVTYLAAADLMQLLNLFW